ncbi:hypothetical protein GCM10007358_12660 [Phocicoccus schoeneichii]|nr:hypothetical protein GCM10007358_12660 [Jeotgalicoccus schoeneichii]
MIPRQQAAMCCANSSSVKLEDENRYNRIYDSLTSIFIYIKIGVFLFEKQWSEHF